METEKTKSVIVISAFGRGQWIAGELARAGFSAKLIDISERLGRWSPEEGEGPFGYVSTGKLSSSMQERLVADDLPEPTANGFTVWLNSGPLELKSPVTRHRLTSLEQDPKIVEWLSNLSTGSSSGEALSTQRKNELLKIPFMNRWIGSLAFDFSSTRFSPAPECFLQGEPENLMQTYNLRHPTRPGYDRSLKWASDQGVEVISNAQVTDVAIKGKMVDGFEVTAGRSQIHKADHFIWMLSSEETRFVSKNIFNTLFSNQYAEPSWSWVRYRLKFKECREREVLPLCFLIMDEIEFPWTHDNYIFVKKTLSRDIFDAWIRVPTTQRFLKQYLEEMGDRILARLSSKAERLSPVVVDYPQEYIYTYDDIGPSRVPVFNEDEIKKIVHLNAPNIHFDGPEIWPRQDWEAQLVAQQKIVKKIQHWWELKQIELKKRENKK